MTIHEKIELFRTVLGKVNNQISEGASIVTFDHDDLHCRHFIFVDGVISIHVTIPDYIKYPEQIK